MHDQLPVMHDITGLGPLMAELCSDVTHDMQSLVRPILTFIQWPLSQPATTMSDTFLSFLTQKYQSYNITMLLCFKLDASTQVDIFTKVIKNTKKKIVT